MTVARNALGKPEGFLGHSVSGSEGTKVKIATVLGARPQFVKAAVVSRALRAVSIEEVIIHTGQHYDDSMSQVFFDQLGLLPPKYNLHIGSGTHGVQTGKMLAATEAALMAEEPVFVLIYGDTNSTLAGALAAAKLKIPLAHVEAGLRSFNRAMPEEINRVVADHLSTLLFAPTAEAVSNLKSEGMTQGVHLVGDVMQDALAEYLPAAEATSVVLAQAGVKNKDYILATVHRAENVDDPDRMTSIIRAFACIAARCPVVWPVHPRVPKNMLHGLPDNIRLLPPVSYLDMLALERHARVILTDSGGVQKEARWLAVPCVTLRDETEWNETLEMGWNRLAGTSSEGILLATSKVLENAPRAEEIAGSTGAGLKIAQTLSHVIADSRSHAGKPKTAGIALSQGSAKGN
jgi:UDP-N-acetylglucosamine 2-epimerase